MRIALLSTFGPEVRGISYYSDCLLAALRAREELDLLPADYDKIYPEWLHPAARKTRSQGENRTVHYARPWTWRLDQSRPDLIHLQAWTSITALMHLRMLGDARRAGVPSVLTLHNPTAHEKTGLLNSLQKRCLRLADCIVLHDACGLEALPPDCQHKVRIIPHGTEVLDLSDEDLHNVNDREPYLLYFGNIRPYKGIELLVSAWQRAVDQIPEVTLLVAGQLWRGGNFWSRLSARLLGTAKYAAGIEQMASDRSLKRVRFRLEFIDDGELDELIRGARYTIFPYLHFSGHSGAVARAASNGTPVLVSSVGGLPGLAVDTGNVFPAGDPEALAELLVKKLRSPVIDYEERAKQLTVASETSWSRVAAMHAEMYRELVTAG